MRRQHLDNTTFFVFPKCVIPKTEKYKIIFLHIVKIL